jgi:Holliday junction resolvase RusA-like endonuclease
MDGELKKSWYLRFEVEGQPRPKQSFKFSRLVQEKTGGKKQGYIPAGIKAWIDEVGFRAKEAMQGREPTKKPVAVYLQFRRKDKTRVDLDNLEKAVHDAMNGIVYVDDSQVFEAGKTKRLGSDNPGVTIYIWEVVNDHAS